MSTRQGDYLELRSLPQQDLPALLKIYQGTPLYFEAQGLKPAQLTLATVEQQWVHAQTIVGRELLGMYHLETNLLIGVLDHQYDYPFHGAHAIWLLLIWGGFQRQGYGQECMALITHDHEDLWALASTNDEGHSFLGYYGFRDTNQQAPLPVGGGSSTWLRRFSSE